MPNDSSAENQMTFVRFPDTAFIDNRHGFLLSQAVAGDPDLNVPSSDSFVTKSDFSCAHHLQEHLFSEHLTDKNTFPLAELFPHMSCWSVNKMIFDLN